MTDPRVDAAIARFDEVIARYAGTPESGAARRRKYARDVASVGKRLANIAIALAVLIAATVTFAFVVGPIGMGGFLAVVAAVICAILFFAIWPAASRREAYSDDLPTKTVVHQLDSYLVGRRALLPAPAVQRIDAISAQLPLLEARLDQADALDPLAQDARRLMGKHLPELIDRYERIPAAYRRERDGGGKTVEERLVSGLDAAREALDDIGSKLAKDDLAAFETQGRFLESRYKENHAFEGD